jgi:hypothetical protein
MNKRIRQLAEECGLLYRQLGPSVETRYMKKKEETIAAFAELIVRECLNQCYNRGMNDELYAGQLKAAAYIEQHFGVEE